MVRIFLNIPGKINRRFTTLIQAYKLFLSESKHAEEPLLISEELIKNIHKVITKDTPHKQNIPGNYRNGKVEVGDKAHGGIYRPPKTLIDVEQLMKEYVQWLNSEEILKLPLSFKGTNCPLSLQCHSFFLGWKRKNCQAN